MNVRCELECWPVDEEHERLGDERNPSRQKLVVESDKLAFGRKATSVVITLPDGTRLEVDAAEMIAATQNASNVGDG